jgi:hypothetical protein
MLKTIYYKLDKTYEINLTMRAIARFETVSKKCFSSLDIKDMNVNDQVALIWAGMNLKDFTTEDLMDLIEAHSTWAELYSTAVLSALSALPELAKTEEPKPTISAVKSKPKNAKRA